MAKPDLSNGIWASTGAVTDPGAAKTIIGWIAEIPPHQYQNWWQERADEFIFHVNEEGIAEWDAATDYPVDGWAKGSDGNVYVSLQTPNVNQDPISEPTYWELLADNLGSGGAGTWSSVVEIEDGDLTSDQYTFSTSEIEDEALYVFTGTNTSVEFILPAIAAAQNLKSIWLKNDSTDDTVVLTVTPNAADKIDRKDDMFIAVKEGAVKITEMDDTGFTNVTKQWVSS